METNFLMQIEKVHFFNEYLQNFEGVKIIYCWDSNEELYIL